MARTSRTRATNTKKKKDSAPARAALRALSRAFKAHDRIPVTAENVVAALALAEERVETFEKCRSSALWEKRRLNPLDGDYVPHTLIMAHRRADSALAEAQAGLATWTPQVARLRMFAAECGHAPLEPEAFATLATVYQEAAARDAPHAERMLYPTARFVVALDAPVRFVGRERLLLYRGHRWHEATESQARDVLLAWLRTDTRVQHAFRQQTLDLVTSYPGDIESISLDVRSALPADAQETALQAAARRDMRLLQLLREQPELQVTPVTTEGQETSEFREDPPWLLNTPHGVYDVRTGQRLTGGPDDLFGEHGERAAYALRLILSTAVAPAEQADATSCPTFLAALARALPDQEVRDWLQVALGATLCGQNTADMALWLLGPPGTGKSTVTVPVQAALGAYATTIETSALLRTKPNFPRLARLRGKRLVLLAEMDKRYSLDAARYKQLTGGGALPGASGDEDPVAHDHWRPQFVMVFETNTAPSFGDVTGLERRTRVVPFERPLGADMTYGLREHIRDQEKAGVLRWLLDGAVRYAATPQQLALDRAPQAIQQATRTLLAADNPEELFFSGLEHTPTEKTAFSVLYDRLVSVYALAKKTTPTKRAFSAELARRGFAVFEGGGHKRYVRAI